MGDITALLHEWRDGSREAEDKLFVQVFPDLRRLAHHFMRLERPDHTMQATELADQAYLRLINAKNQDWQNRGHFFAIAGRVMRRYLIDQARRRPEADFVPLTSLSRSLAAEGGKLDLAITVDRLLDELSETHPEWCRVVEVKYFLGLTDQEAADALGVKVRSLQRTWRDARQWLFERVESLQ